MFQFVTDILTGKKHIQITDHANCAPKRETPSEMMDRAMAAHRARTDALFSTPMFKK